MALDELRFPSQNQCSLNHTMMSSYKNKFNLSLRKTEKQKTNLDLLLNSYTYATKPTQFYEIEVFK